MNFPIRFRIWVFSSVGCLQYLGSAKPRLDTGRLLNPFVEKVGGFVRGFKRATMLGAVQVKKDRVVRCKAQGSRDDLRRDIVRVRIRPCGAIAYILCRCYL